MRKLSFLNILLNSNRNFINGGKIFKRIANKINDTQISKNSKKFIKGEDSYSNNTLSKSGQDESGLKDQSKENLKSESKRELENNSVLNPNTCADTSFSKKEKVFCTFRFDDQFNSVENLPKEFAEDADEKTKNEKGQACVLGTNNSKSNENSSTNSKANEPLKNNTSNHKDSSN